LGLKNKGQFDTILNFADEILQDSNQTVEFGLIYKNELCFAQKNNLSSNPLLF